MPIKLGENGEWRFLVFARLWRSGHLQMPVDRGKLLKERFGSIFRILKDVRIFNKKNSFLGIGPKKIFRQMRRGLSSDPGWGVFLRVKNEEQSDLFKSHGLLARRPPRSMIQTDADGRWNRVPIWIFRSEKKHPRRDLYTANLILVMYPTHKCTHRKKCPKGVHQMVYGGYFWVIGLQLLFRLFFFFF